MNHFPPEWHRQSCVAIAWPRKNGDFAPCLDAVEAVYRNIAREISCRQTLLIICADAAHRTGIERQLEQVACPVAKIIFVPASYDDVWVRDTLPISVLTPSGWNLLDFGFNGWGGKYPCNADSAIASRLYQAELFSTCDYQQVDLVLEGGAIETDGQGSLLATRGSIMDLARNPGPNLAEMETLIENHLGINRFLWLDYGCLDGDDTGGHIDTVARFCSTDTIAYTSCEDRNDPQFESLRGLRCQLKKLKTAIGELYKLLPLPLPQPIYNDKGQRLPATYANFLITNNAVLIPTYNDPMDTIAADGLREVFPGREIISIDCGPIIQQFGGLHCATMQFPEAIQVKRLLQ